MPSKSSYVLSSQLFFIRTDNLLLLSSSFNCCIAVLVSEDLSLIHI